MLFRSIDAALRMGQPGDLLLIFADALTRSWKQVTKFKPELTLAPAPMQSAVTDTPDDSVAQAVHDDGTLLAAGFVRDERGLRFVGEADD